MGVGKVVFGGRTLVDLTADTVSASSLRKGATAHDAKGNRVTGTLEEVEFSVSGGVLALSGGRVSASAGALSLDNPAK